VVPAKPIEERRNELQHQSDRASEVALAASGLNNDGIQLEKSGDVPGALAKYRAALDLDPTGFGFRLNYALALCRIGWWHDGVWNCTKCCDSIQTMQTPLRHCFIASEQARAQTGDVRKHP
jgi:hypothetical protein